MCDTAVIGSKNAPISLETLFPGRSSFTTVSSSADARWRTNPGYVLTSSISVDYICRVWPRVHECLAVLISGVQCAFVESRYDHISYLVVRVVRRKPHTCATMNSPSCCSVDDHCFGDFLVTSSIVLVVVVQVCQ